MAYAVSFSEALDNVSNMNFSPAEYLKWLSEIYQEVAVIYQARRMIHGFYPVNIGEFESKELAMEAIMEDVRVNSAIFQPRYVASKKPLSKQIRIDYGAKDCYYLIERRENVE